MSGRKIFNLSVLAHRGGVVLFLAAVFLVSGLAGCLFAGSLSDSSDLTAFIKTYGLSMRSGEVDVSFLLLLFDTVRIPLVVFLMSFAPFGLLGIPLVFGYRGFCFSYAVSVLYSALGNKGLLVAFLLFGLSALLWFPVLLVLGSEGVAFSGRVLSRLFLDRRGGCILDRGFVLRCAVCFCVILVCALIEYWVVPTLFSVFVTLF